MRKGFKFIEMLVVMSITAILAAVIVPSYLTSIEKTKIARLISDVTNIKTAALAYYKDVGTWPPDVCPQDDPGFMAWSVYTRRCCGQNDDMLIFGGPQVQQTTVPGNAPYDNFVQANWNGPYLDRFPVMTPWGGSYDWEFWPGGGWGLPAGTYVSARPRYIPWPGSCAAAANPAETDVPDRYEIRLQQMEDYDKHHPGGVNVASDNVIVEIMRFQ